MNSVSIPERQLLRRLHLLTAVFIAGLVLSGVTAIPLEQEVRLQPANPEPWLQLAQFELNKLKRPRAALAAIRPAIYLDPRSSETVAVFLAAQRQTHAP